MPSNPPTSARSAAPAIGIGPNTQIGLSLSNLITVLVVVGGGVMAYSKIPDEQRVKEISAETNKATMEEFRKQAATDRAAADQRMGSLENEYKATRAELAKMNDRMDKMLIILAGSSSAALRSPGGRRAAETVRRNLEGGNDPLSGLGLEE